MANFNNPNDYSWQNQQNNQNYSINGSNAFGDSQTLGKCISSVLSSFRLTYPGHEICLLKAKMPRSQPLTPNIYLPT